MQGELLAHPERGWILPHSPIGSAPQAWLYLFSPVSWLPTVASQSWVALGRGWC